MYFPSVPLSYAVEITYACNNVCSGCSNAWESKRHEKLENWRALFDRIAPPHNRGQYAELIRITGGEPTLHNAFAEIVKYVDSFGVAHSTFSTGCWKQPNEIIDTFKRCQNFIGLLVSLHGSTAAAHNAFVESGDKAFGETCTNIERAADAGIDVYTNTVLTRHSCNQIEEVIALAKRLGARYAVFNRFLGKAHPLEPDEKQLREAITLIERLHEEGRPCRIGNCVPPCFVANSSEGENSGMEHCAISPQGFVRPDNLTAYVFGNIFEQSVEDIWRSEKAQWYRRQIPADCHKCVALPRCRGGCRSVSIEYGLGRDRLMKEPIVQAPAETMTLAPSLKPVPHFNIRQEPFGYLLTRYNWSVPVAPEAKPLLDAINGENTLAWLQTQFGEDALDFIGHLYRERCIGFE